MSGRRNEPVKCRFACGWDQIGALETEISFYQARFLDTVAEAFSQEQACVYRTARIDLHLSVKEKGYGFGLKSHEHFS